MTQNLSTGWGFQHHCGLIFDPEASSQMEKLLLQGLSVPATHCRGQERAHPLAVSVEKSVSCARAGRSPLPEKTKRLPDMLVTPTGDAAEARPPPRLPSEA